MTEKAEPTVIDSGTLFPEVKICRHCFQKIERGDPLVDEYAGAGPWVHSDGKSPYCSPLTQEEQEEVYGGPLPEGLTIRRFTPQEIKILDDQ